MFKSKNRNKRVFFCIPAYNEEKNIIPLIEKIENLNKNWSNQCIILAIDDGSKDSTYEKIMDIKSGSLSTRINVTRHDKNMGLGKTLNELLTKAAKLSSESDQIVTLDADNTHPPKLVKEMSNIINNGSANLVIASRYLKGSKEVGLSNLRKILSKVLNVFVGMLFPIKKAKDYSNGFRVYQAQLLKKAIEDYGSTFITRESFSSQLEILLKLRPFLKRVEEVPLVLRYDLKGGTSEMKIVQTIWEYLRTIGYFSIKGSILD